MISTFAKRDGAASFTFQYGSASIHFFCLLPCFLKSFTFQYGSTSIKRTARKKPIMRNLHSNMVLLQWPSLTGSSQPRFIYIPIWFYFNLRHTSGSSNHFHIYIPIWFYFNGFRTAEVKDIWQIYIPIWFYFNWFCVSLICSSIYLHSNMVLLQWSNSGSIVPCKCIYIPIWFYFNDLFCSSHARNSQFTFQYGSTSMMLIAFLTTTHRNLHSNMVLLQYII